MTPREPDRFDAQARELLDIINDGPNDRLGNIAAALRAAESSALNAVRQYVEARPECSQLAMLRLLDDLIPPAAAPAAEALCAKCGKVEDSSEHHDGLHGTASAHEFEPAPAADYDPITAPIPEGDMNGPHGPLRTMSDEESRRLSTFDAQLAKAGCSPAAETGKAQGALDELAAVLRGKDEMGEKLAKALGVPAGPLGHLVDAAIARIAELEAAVAAAHVQGDPPGDWACAECHPHSELLTKGFRCWWHLGESIERAKLAARAAPPEGET